MVERIEHVTSGNGCVGFSAGPRLIWLSAAARGGGGAEPAPSVAALRAAPEAGPFAVFVGVLGDLLLEHGAVRARATLWPLFAGEDFDTRGLDEAALQSLSAFCVGDGARARATAGFLATVRAWRGSMEGGGHDLSACGDKTLDRFAAEICAALLGAPARAEELRLKLRRRGVAAFGLLSAA